MKLVLLGRPATKKNRGIPIAATSKVTGRKFTKILPNKEYREWEQRVILQCRAQRKGKLAAITDPCLISATFYEHPMQRGDLGGYFDALCDALQAAGVVDNDRRFRQSGPMAIVRDRDNPRVEVEITVLEQEAAA